MLACFLAEFLEGAVEMTETEVKKKIASSTQDALNVVTAERLVMNALFRI